ncbi:MAG: alpha/beta hydrolase [Spirochaetota bacterium]|nr:alpha/beta hydrolase [Spirochaetota bacterium]
MEERKVSDFAFVSSEWPLDPNKQTLIFIHGAGGSSTMWLNQVDALMVNANTIAIDLPGHGRSSGQGRCKITDYAKSVVEFIDLIKVPKPILIGLSMGGAITLQTILDFSERIAAAVLISTGAKLRVLPVIFETIENNFDEFIKMMGKFSISNIADPKILHQMMDEMAKQDPRVTLKDFRACDSFNVMERLSEINMPTLIITAENDNLTTPKYGKFLEERINGAQRTHIMDAGHIVSLEKPEEVNQAIGEFIKGLES